MGSNERNDPHSEHRNGAKRRRRCLSNSVSGRKAAKETGVALLLPGSPDVITKGGHLSRARGRCANLTMDPSQPPLKRRFEDDHIESPGNTNSRRRSSVVEDNTYYTPMRDLPPLPVQRSCDIYYRHLAVKGRGSPLFLPEPSSTLPDVYRRRGIAIGDVGIITAYGGFDFMFNICLPADHPINQQSLPEGFSPIPIPLKSGDTYKIMKFRPSSHLASASVRRESNSSGIAFESSASEGAILTMSHGAHSEDLTNVSRFRKYVSANLESWYRYVNNIRGREARNGDVRLVIGCDKASSWGMATFANSTAQDFHLKFKSTGDNGSTRTYGWECSGVIEERAGPDPKEMEELKSSDDSGNSGEYRNQCLFVRTMNATLRDDVWQGLGFDFEPVTDTRSDSTCASATSVHIPDFNTVLTTHPSKSINDFMLTAHPHARIAITEDDAWSSLTVETDQHLCPPEALINRMLTTYAVCEADSVVFPRLKQETSDVISSKPSRSLPP